MTAYGGCSIRENGGVERPALTCRSPSPGRPPGSDHEAGGGKTDVRPGDTVNEVNPEITAERFFGERL